MKAVRIFLLILIVIGLGFIATQSLWVPTVVNAILQYQENSPSLNFTISTKQKPTPSIKAGTNQAILGYVDINAFNRALDIKVLPLTLTVENGGSDNNLSNCRLIENGKPLWSDGSDAFSPIIGNNLFGMSAQYSIGLIIPKGNMETFGIACDVAKETPNGATFSWGLNANEPAWITNDETGASNFLIGTNGGNIVMVNK